MSRDIGAANIAAVEASHVEPVLLVKLEFSVPVYAHSGYGTITYDGDIYLGVGDLGNVTEATESEVLTPGSINLELSGINARLLAESLNAGNFGDLVTIYEGYRQDDGTLVDDPWILWSGFLEVPSSAQGEEGGVVRLTCQHDIAVLDKKDGGRFTDEDQVQRYAGDRFFEFVTDTSTVSLEWGGRPVFNGIDDENVPPGTDRR